MVNRKSFVSFQRIGWRKGFYNDEDFNKTLRNIRFSDFFDEPDDEAFPYSEADNLLSGSCHLFSLALKRVLGYRQYIIQGDNKVNFHAFCQIYKKGIWFYIDARGITTSFDEFMDVARTFVSDTYTIREVTQDEIDDWAEEDYFDEAIAFSEAIINKFKEHYIL